MTHNPYGGPHADVLWAGHAAWGRFPARPAESPASGYPFGPFAPDQGTAGPFAKSGIRRLVSQTSTLPNHRPGRSRVVVGAHCSWLVFPPWP